ncbi:MAG: hypothetical protein OJF49_000177 [Ktedonobacterales bacterium]|nr:MAG: hypothetical protein OJF49_000177 [Ktedonobacterales bacterium]
MRIVVAHSRLSTFGGGERATLELLRRLECRHEVALWAGHYAAEKTFAGLRAFNRKELGSVEWLVRSPDADVVISQTFGSNLLALHHPRTICYLHSMRAPYLSDSRRPDLIVRRIFDRAAVSKAAAFLTNSQFTAAAAAQVYGRAPEVVPPGVATRYFSHPVSSGTYMLYVGRLAPEKGIERMLAWSADVPMDLVLVGDGEAQYTQHLRQVAGPRVRFAGPLEGEALATMYVGCRCLVFLPYAEEFGLAALEAMAAAKPVLASAEGGLQELVHDGETGFLVRNQEQFLARFYELLDSDALCAQLGQRGREVAQAYTWDGFAQRIEDICVSLCP